MLIINYALISALFILVAIACYVTTSFVTFLVSAVFYYCLLEFHHRSKIKDDEKTLFDDYVLTTEVMNFSGMIAVTTTAIFLIALYVMN
ncbi:MAG: hypothetical protein PHW24_01720 [Candidatus Moranbacteria bacterium]|nr:hypothetical protein [Candidatus Moranbacteria bacterium]